VRIQLKGRPAARGLCSRNRDERGAVAIIVGAVAVVLCLLAGFAVDFGMAYNSKRQLQTAADSAALNAAATYAEHGGSCASLSANAEYKDAAQTVADTAAEANRPGQTGGTLGLACLPDGSLEVSYESTGTTTSMFGPLAGGGSVITAQRSGAASVTVSPKAPQRVRPMVMCSAALPPVGSLDKTFSRIDSPGDGHAAVPSCPGAGAPGNWWTIDCPEERTGSTSTLVQQILDGCATGASIAGTGADANALTVSLQTACPSAPEGSETCLSGDPGQLDSGSIEDSWQVLIDAQEPIVLPVFCVAPQCTESTLDGTGTNAIFPIYKLASVVVCGYHFGKNVRYSPAMALTDPCSGNPLPSIVDDGSADNYFHMVFVPQRTSGGTTQTTCGLGAVCDGGLRRVLLSR
jgi:hypothetical protein